MTETKISLLQRLNNKLESLSNLAFSKKVFPFTLVLIFILFITYAMIFYTWFFSPVPLLSGPSTGARVVLTQLNTNTSEKSSIGVAVNLDDIQGTAINGLQVIAQLQGTVPDDIIFTPKTVDGLEPIVTTIDHSGGTPTLKIAFLKPLTKEYVVNQPFLEIGALTFTKPTTGTLTISFSPTLNKVLEKDSLENVMVQPEDVSYSF